MGAKPVTKYKVCDYIESSQFPKLYENDCLFDRFDVRWSPNGRYLSTGLYNDSFSVIDTASEPCHLTMLAKPF